MGSVDHKYVTFSFVVAMVMEKLRVEVNYVNDIETYLEEDLQKRHFSSLQRCISSLFLGGVLCL